jgi:hypothetical protein
MNEENGIEVVLRRVLMTYLTTPQAWKGMSLDPWGGEGQCDNFERESQKIAFHHLDLDRGNVISNKLFPIYQNLSSVASPVSTTLYRIPMRMRILTVGQRVWHVMEGSPGGTPPESNIP